MIAGWRKVSRSPAGLLSGSFDAAVAQRVVEIVPGVSVHRWLTEFAQSRRSVFAHSALRGPSSRLLARLVSLIHSML